MRVMVLGSGNRDTEAGVRPTAEALQEMLKYNEALMKSGVVLEGQGLMPTSTAKRVRFEGSKRTVIDGPFAETKEIIAGYWIWQVRSMDEAVEWLKRAPFDGGVEVTLRQQFTWKAPTDEDAMIRVVVFVPGTRDSEAGVIPPAELIERMTKFNEDLVKAGVMLDGQGLPVPEEALHRHFNEMQKRTALILYGRNMYEVMKFWDTPPAESREFEREYARTWQATPKVVFSTTLESVGPNARLVKAKADVEPTVRRLKAETNGDIQVNGAGLAASLIRFGLVDEFRLYVMPVVLGGGKPYFEAGLQLELEPLGTQSLPQSCTLLRFRPKQS